MFFQSLTLLYLLTFVASDKTSNAPGDKEYGQPRIDETINVVPPSNAVSSCGSVEKSLSGSIFNRGYPQPFPVGTNCMWMITGPENKLIRFTLQTYRQHEKEHASNIFEVWTLKEKKVLRLSPIRASGLQTSRDIFGPLIFKFVHNRKLAPGQFLINYKTTDTNRPSMADKAHDQCGEYLTSENGSISYPPPGNQFTEEVRCLWVIEAQPNDLIVLKSNVFVVQDSPNDYVEIWTFDKESLGKEHVFNRHAPPEKTLVFRQSVMIWFHPDGNSDNYRWSFEYQKCDKYAPNEINRLPEGETRQQPKINPNGYVRNEINQLPEGEIRPQPRINPNGYVRNEINQLPEGETRPQPRINPNGYADERPTLDPSCSSVYKTPSGNIHNVEYPQPFANGTNCMWIVIPPENKYIRFTLKGHCLHEKEHIANIFEVWTLSGKEVLRLNPIRASDLEVGKYTPGPLIFKFVHNRKLEPGRFLVDYRATDTSGSPMANQANDQCGEYLTSESGKISYPLPRSQFTEEVRCLWVIENQPNHQIHFNMTKFDVPNTSRDYIEIWVFDSKNVIKKYVMDRESRPKKVFRFRRSVMIWFHPFGNRPNSKFSFEYTRVIKQDATKVRKRT